MQKSFDAEEKEEKKRIRPSSPSGAAETKGSIEKHLVNGFHCSKYQHVHVCILVQESNGNAMQMSRMKGRKGKWKEAWMHFPFKMEMALHSRTNSLEI